MKNAETFNPPTIEDLAGKTPQAGERIFYMGNEMTIAGIDADKNGDFVLFKTPVNTVKKVSPQNLQAMPMIDGWGWGIKDENEALNVKPTTPEEGYKEFLELAGTSRCSVLRVGEKEEMRRLAESGPQPNALVRHKGANHFINYIDNYYVHFGHNDQYKVPIQFLKAGVVYPGENPGPVNKCGWLIKDETKVEEGSRLPKTDILLKRGPKAGDSISPYKNFSCSIKRADREWIYFDVYRVQKEHLELAKTVFGDCWTIPDKSQIEKTDTVYEYGMPFLRNPRWHERPL